VQFRAQMHIEPPALRCHITFMIERRSDRNAAPERGTDHEKGWL